MRNSSVTVIVPALNEEKNLGPTLEKLTRVLPKYWSEWKILVFNDGSTDRTGDIANEFAAKFPEIEAVHHASPKSLGFVFRSGMTRVDSDFAMMVHGQNDITIDSLRKIFEVPETDLVIPYQTNTHERPLLRRILSRGFVRLVNGIHGLKINYYNHYVLYRRDVLEGIQIRNDGYAFQAEILVRLLKGRGCSYAQVPIQDDFSNKKKSNALKPRNVARVCGFFVSTLTERLIGVRG